MPALLRSEAEERARSIRVRRTHIELDLRRPEAFTSVTTLDVETTAPTFVDFQGTKLVALEIDGEPVAEPDWRDGRIALDVVGAHRVTVRGEMAYSTDGEGLHQHIDPADGRRYLYAMSFLDAAPRWFACVDQPDVKTVYSLDVLTPRGWTVAGNSPATEIAPGRHRLARSRPLATYFVTVIAGEWASLDAEHDGVRLVLHTRHSLAAELAVEAADVFNVTARCLDAYHGLFGVRYPFGEYHQAFVPDFNAGAMENPGCVTFRDQFIFRGAATRSERANRAGVIAHEMAHQWFGDLVTMAWWDDLWLNESFAEFMAHEVVSRATDYDLWTEFGLTRKGWGSVADQSPSTHPVAGNGAPDTASALNQFDGISYAKGAAVLRQLHTLIGEDAFFAGLRAYLGRFAFGNATLADLLGHWEDAAGRDLDAWSRAWLLTSGMDTLALDADGERLLRTPPGGSTSAREHAIEVVRFAPDGTERERRPVLVDAEAVSVGWATPPGPDDVLLPDAGDVTWARVRPRRYPEPLTAVTDKIARVVLVNALIDQVRAAELDPAAALDALATAIPAEPSDVVLGSVLAFATRTLAGPFAAPAERAPRLAAIAAAAEAAMINSDEGSDRQLVAWRALIVATDEVERLRGWLEDAGLPPGQRLDPELRWSVLSRLSQLHPDPAPIERALADDRSASARVHAARCRASLPSEAAKRDAFDAFSGPARVSSYELYALAEGFFVPTQDELTAPYVSRYFELVPGLARYHRGWTLRTVTGALFPASFSDPATLARAEALLGRPDLDDGVRRSLADAVDGLRRATTSRERFGPTSRPTAM